MIIPTPYEDELLYSIIARYKAWNGIILDNKAMYDLFRTESRIQNVDLPTHIKAFAQRTGFDIEFLIHEATLFDYYSAFKTKRIREAALSMIQGNTRNRIDNALGIYKSKFMFAKLNYLRFCPECWEEDIKISGESYWRKLHQVPGVVVCPTHQRILHNSKVSNLTRCIDIASKENCFPSKPILNLNERELSLSLEIVKDIQWVFKNYKTIIKYDSLSPEIYLSKIIIENRFIMENIPCYLTTNDRFLGRFKQLYGNNLINEWNLIIDKEWLYKTIFGFINHPSSHILLIHILYGSIENLFQLPDFMDFQSSYHQNKQNWFFSNVSDVYKSEIYSRIESYKSYYAHSKYVDHYEIPDYFN